MHIGPTGHGHPESDGASAPEEVFGLRACRLHPGIKQAHSDENAAMNHKQAIPSHSVTACAFHRLYKLFSERGKFVIQFPFTDGGADQIVPSLFGKMNQTLPKTGSEDNLRGENPKTPKPQNPKTP